MKMKRFLNVVAIGLMVLVFSQAAFGEVLLNRQQTWNAVQNFDKGITVSGQTVVPAKQVSKEFYVCSANGQDTMGNGYGMTYDKPFDTIEYAITQARADYGDVIYLLPSHNEGITGAAGIDFDKAGLTIVGVGVGDDMPTIDFDHADATVAVGANNITLYNIRFRTSANAVTVGLDIEAAVDGTRVLNCEFGYAETATDEFAIALRNNAGCDRTIIDGCYFNAGAQAAVTAISLTGASDRPTIRNCEFWGNHSTAMINGITTLSTLVLIDNNKFFQGSTEPAIELLTNTTGMISNNLIKTNLATMVASIVADATFLFQNYYNEDVNPGTGALIGTASAND